MSLEMIMMAAAAVLPALALLIFIYKKDKVEKEPIGLLLLLLGAGVVICFPAGWLEELFSFVIDEIFGYAGGVIYLLVSNFIGVALIEEGLKWGMLLLITRKNKNFNSYFDGLIYAVCVSLGFAAFENIGYVLMYGWGTAGTRALTAVPGHMFFGVIMGFYYTEWNVFRKARTLEIQAKQTGGIRIEKLTDVPKSKLLLSILMPVLVHGFYDFCLDMSSMVFTVVFIAFLIALYIFCFKKISTVSKADIGDEALAAAVFLTRHPELRETYDAYMAQGNIGAPSPVGAAGMPGTGTPYARSVPSVQAPPQTPAAGMPGSAPSACKAVYAPTAGTVIRISVNVGNRVAAGDELMLLRNEKAAAPIAVYAVAAGTVEELYAAVGETVRDGSPIAMLRF